MTSPKLLFRPFRLTALVPVIDCERGALDNELVVKVSPNQMRTSVVEVPSPRLPNYAKPSRQP